MPGGRESGLASSVPAPLTTRSEWALESHQLAKRYGRSTWALNSITLAIPWGQVTALVGPNAAGKSTLIKTWVGFERPTSGHACVAGLDAALQREAALASVGYLPQTPALYRDLTVGDHVDLVAHLSRSYDRSYAQRRLADLGIPTRARASQLSGGQAAQVGLALVLGSRAPILLLDEPLASLDPLARREFLDVLRDAVRADGVTAVLSSHVVRDVEQGSDRLVVLGAGRKLLDSTLTDAVAAHRVVGPSVTVADDLVVGGLPGADGRLVRAWGFDVVDGAREATLEEVVVGYLVQGRALAPETAAAARGSRPG